MTKIYRMRLILAMTAAVLAAEPVAHAQQQSQSSPPAASASAAETPDARREREVGEALDAMKDAVKAGPVSIPLLDQGRIDVPEGYIFVPRAEAARFLTALGNRTGDNFLGMLLSAKDGFDWFALLDYDKVGYVKDDDARDWNADDLLAKLFGRGKKEG